MARDHPARALLRLRPNRFMSISDLLWATEFQRLDTGNAYWVADYGRDGRAKNIYLLDSSRVTIWIQEGIPDDPRSIYYTYEDPKKGRLVYLADEVMHFKNFSLDGIQGRSIRSYIASTIANENAAPTSFRGSTPPACRTRSSSSMSVMPIRRPTGRFRTSSSGSAGRKRRQGDPGTDPLSGVPAGDKAGKLPVFRAAGAGGQTDCERFRGQELSAE